MQIDFDKIAQNAHDEFIKKLVTKGYSSFSSINLPDDIKDNVENYTLVIDFVLTTISSALNQYDSILRSELKKQGVHLE
ncbi:hypothetical protein [Petroclostridium xylanilyticum]|jgi:hypothetical protein|uniref:hypothetical protein n=1 Tax=Petroclostridium xylanilyticum TaxID=1792311 RepID=UPI000B97F62F|nr:hypothetical protein [Petroclostridium xylanilyticum]